MQPFALGIAATCLHTLPALAADPLYLDDRSNAAALVQSLYNAINRREYARAWSYFGDQKPAKDLQAFAKGYEATGRVDIETGPFSEEGAAGSIFYSVPVAIRATGTDAREHVFAGCYTARLVNPAMQEDTFASMVIEKGTLKPAEGELAAVLPASCGDGPPPPSRDAVLETVKKRFASAYGGACRTLEPDAEPGAADPVESIVAFRQKSDAASDPERQARLFRFPCDQAAYNSAEVYYLASPEGFVQALQFATPELDIRYESNDDQAKVESVTVMGFTATDKLVNSDYSPETHTIESYNKWRGIGDASTIGRWLFRDGSFTLVKYDVDASYDGEINPEPVLDYDTAP
ncbi:DUF1176 domain-containing protein [Mesorhizobium sp. NBSH29]|nr:DUF1176 domain-containing protein [Mesorhizobium sp. NBSH29]